MGLIVLPATISDITEVFDAYFAAFGVGLNRIVLDILFPQGINEEFRKIHSEHTLQYWHTVKTEHVFKCIDTDTGKIVGMSIWDVFWKERSEEERKAPSIDWLQGKERERALRFLGPAWEKKEELIGGNKHVYLKTIAVHPEHQRRGIGKLLMEWGMDVAEKLGVPVYLEATHAGVPLYEKVGLEKVGGIVWPPEVTHLDSDIEAPLMVKMPSAAKGMTLKEWAESGCAKN